MRLMNVVVNPHSYTPKHPKGHSPETLLVCASLCVTNVAVFFMYICSSSHKTHSLSLSRLMTRGRHRGFVNIVNSSLTTASTPRYYTCRYVQ
jgi:hypothetical protein